MAKFETFSIDYGLLSFSKAIIIEGTASLTL